MRYTENDKITVFKLYAAIDDVRHLAHGLDWEPNEARFLNDIHRKLWLAIQESYWVSEYYAWKKGNNLR